MSGDPSTAAPYSTVPRVETLTRLPALRAMNSSPSPCPPKTISGGTRLSAHEMMVAQGAWWPATAALLALRSTVQSSGWLMKLWLHALSAPKQPEEESADEASS